VYFDVGVSRLACREIDINLQPVEAASAIGMTLAASTTGTILARGGPVL
jgi:hypothetical protein